MFGSKPCASAAELVAANSAVASTILVLVSMMITPRFESLGFLKSCCFSRLLRRGHEPRRCTRAMDASRDFQSRDAAHDHVFLEEIVMGVIDGAISYNSAQSRTRFLR